MIHSVFGLHPLDIASSLIITRTSWGMDDFIVGFGTNIIADLYMAFGTPGVVILMALLGYFISWILKKSVTNLYALMTYGVMMSYAVTSVHTEYTFSLRVLLWSLLILNIVSHYNLSFTVRTEK